MALEVVARPGDTVAVESPTYFGLLHTLQDARTQGTRASDRHDGRDRSDGSGARPPRPRRHGLPLLVMLQQPAGLYDARGEEARDFEVAGAHHVPLVEDDTYGELYFGGERQLPFAALDPHSNTLYCSSFSKTLAPGYRIGWIATRRFLPQVLERKLASPSAARHCCRRRWRSSFRLVDTPPFAQHATGVRLDRRRDDPRDRDVIPQRHSRFPFRPAAS